MKILLDVYKQMINCPDVPPETGGILGAQNDVICVFQQDMGKSCMESAVYTPNVVWLNYIIGQWQKQNILFAGIAHSHPTTQKLLSSDDVQYINKIFQCMPENIEYLYFPIIIPRVEVLSFKAERLGDNIRISKDEIIIVKEK